jgi:hypothetical protein
VDSKTIKILIGGVLIGGITEKCLFNLEEEKIKRPLRELDGLI